MVWSPVQPRLAKQARVTLIRRVPRLVMEVEGMNNDVDFDVIDVIDGRVSYPVLLGIVWANETLAVINFKKHIINFENEYIIIIAPMDHIERRMYGYLVRYEVVKEWDHAYNILED